MSQAAVLLRRHARLAIFVVACLILAHVLLLSRQEPLRLWTGATTANIDNNPLDFLRQANQALQLDLSPTVRYTRKCISPSKGPLIDRSIVPDVPEELVSDFVELDLSQDDDAHVSACATISLSVSQAYSPTKKYPELIFGMATLYQRLHDAMDSIAHWAADSGVKIIVSVEDLPKFQEEGRQLELEYRNRGVHMIILPPVSLEHTMSQSHFTVLSRLYEEAAPETKWFGLLDDDTFYPHLHPLSQTLAGLDHNKHMYVGALAEEWGSIERFGLMAFGGAGVYLSLHLVAMLVEEEWTKKCLEESPSNLGDIIIRDCVYRHSPARLTVLPDLYQHDILGDVRGFFESGVEPLNLHHWKSWFHLPVVAMSMATRFCGNCFLQRWTFGDSTVLANGFSISLYSEGVKSIDLGKMERTWGGIYGGEDPKYEFTLGALRDRVPDEKRVTYFLRHTEVTKGVMRQLYLRKAGESSGQPDEVVELIWTR